MGVHDVGRLSLGQWTAMLRHWGKAHSTKVDAPTENELEAAVGRAGA